MAERTGETARTEAFNDLADALGRYLHTLGWTALVVGRPRIQHQPDALEFNFEFVIDFTGSGGDFTARRGEDSHGIRRWSS